MADGSLPDLQTRMGRPTKFRPEMCSAIIEMGKEGKGRMEMACEIGITKETWNDWQDEESPRYNPDFSSAVKVALQHAQAWWEDKGRQATFNSEGFNATSYIFQMKNRFRDDWADRTVNEQTVNINVNFEERLRARLNKAKLIDGNSIIDAAAGAAASGSRSLIRQ